MQFGKPTMPASMLVPLLLMLLGFTLLFVRAAAGARCAARVLRARTHRALDPRGAVRRMNRATSSTWAATRAYRVAVATR